HQRCGVEQLAQTHVLLGQSRQFLQAALQQQGFGLELLVLGHQLAARGNLLGRTFPGTHGQFGHFVQRRQHHTHQTTHGLERIETGIGHHQYCRQHGKYQHANAQRGTFGEERLNGLLLVRREGGKRANSCEGQTGQAKIGPSVLQCSNMRVPPGGGTASVHSRWTHSVESRSMAWRSIISRALPPPQATQVSGSSATITGRPVSWLSSLSRSRSSAPPPVSTRPRSAMSEASSGGDCSSALLTAWTMVARDSCSASSTSLEFRVKLRGTPSARLRPRTSTSRI